MWLEVLFGELMDVAQSERVSGPVRMICVILISLAFLIGIAGLLLLVFVIEGQSFLRRCIFLILGLVIFACYLQFLNAVVRKDKKGR